MFNDGEILASICGLKEGESELQMSGFEFMNMLIMDQRMKGTFRIWSDIVVLM